MPVLKLGHYDPSLHLQTEEERRTYLRPFHKRFSHELQSRLQFRDDDKARWIPFKKLASDHILPLQQFLSSAGFLPRRTSQDGVYGYVTQAAVRLFQEYVRSVEKKIDIGGPDGIVGNRTRKHIQRWKRAALTSEWKKEEKVSEEYQYWMNLLAKSKKHFTANSHPILEQIHHFRHQSDTIPTEDWTFNPEDVHVVGIRRNEDLSVLKRPNDDIFILLINGKVFKFWGSTDPSQRMATRPDEAFLVEGQHKFGFGWHKRGSKHKVYRALRPFSNGVLVFRDRNNDNALTHEDISIGLDPNPNPTINIHWSGQGQSNFSAGCQVIAGSKYINHRAEVIDCMDFAAFTSNPSATWTHRILGKTVTVALGEKHINMTLTKAAYNVFTDLILVYARPKVDFAYYILGRDDTLDQIDPERNRHFSLQHVLKKMRLQRPIEE